MRKITYEIVDARLHPEMIPIVAQWHHSQWSYLNPGQTLSDRIAKMNAYLVGEHADNAGCAFTPKLFVALSECSEAIATAALDLQDMDDQPLLSPWLASVYVLPEMRKQGVATALVNYAVNYAVTSMGVDTLYLFTPNHKAFYQRLGWLELQQLTYYGETVDLMHYPKNRS